MDIYRRHAWQASQAQPIITDDTQAISFIPSASSSPLALTPSPSSSPTPRASSPQSMSPRESSVTHVTLIEPDQSNVHVFSGKWADTNVKKRYASILNYGDRVHMRWYNSNEKGDLNLTMEPEERADGVIVYVYIAWEITGHERDIVVTLRSDEWTEARFRYTIPTGAISTKILDFNVDREMTRRGFEVAIQVSPDWIPTTIVVYTFNFTRKTQ
jgi:hypothetical protein